MILRVHKIDSEKAWTDWCGRARSHLADRLIEACPSLGKTERKRKAKELLSGGVSELVIENPERLDSVHHVLESVGAIMTVEE